MDHFQKEVLLLSMLLLNIMRIAADQDLQVNVSTGILQGFGVETNEGPAVNFLGVPYAQPPVNNLRFQPPKKAKKWNGIFEAKKYGPNCMQNIALVYGNNTPAKLKDQSEDCLTLNIHVPGKAIDKNTTEKFAVMVYVHGGGFIVGGSIVDDGTFLAAKEGVIVVSLNYRLDIFGFMTTEGGNITGNMGLMDQILALKWIQENIGQFGGDKDRVTVFGISAGGMSVSLLILSPWTKGLFSGAICQSGVEYTRILPEKAMVTEQNIIKHFIEQIGCTAKGEDDVVKCLQRKPADKLITTKFPALSWFNSPIVDGEGGVLPKQPSALWKAPDFKPVKYMAGVLRDDGNVLVNYFPEAVTSDFFEKGIDFQRSSNVIRLGLELQYKDASGNLPFKVNDLIPLVKDNYFENGEDKVSNIRSVLDFSRDIQFIAPTMRSLKAMSRFYSVKCFAYFMTYARNWSVLTGPIDMGPFHADDAEFTFGAYLNNRSKYHSPANSMDMAVSASMMNAWSTFAKYG